MTPIELIFFAQVGVLQRQLFHPVGYEHDLPGLAQAQTLLPRDQPTPNRSRLRNDFQRPQSHFKHHAEWWRRKEASLPFQHRKADFLRLRPLWSLGAVPLHSYGLSSGNGQKIFLLNKYSMLGI